MAGIARRLAVALSMGSLALLAACGGGGGGGPSPTPTPTATPTPGPHAISGAVSGALAAGVTVTLSGSAVRTTTTDGSGAYSFSALADGDYVVTPSKAGHIFQPVRTPVTLAGADATGRNFTATALRLLDDFSSGAIDASRWDSGRQLAIAELVPGTQNHAAFLRAEMANVQPSTGYGTSLKMRLPASRTQVTDLQATVQLTASSATGDTASRAGIDLLYQPTVDRVQGPDNQTNALYARIVLEETVAGGLLARRQLFQCDTPSCSTTTGLGTFTGAWTSAGLAIARGTPYTLRIAVNPATKTFDFRIQGGAYGAEQTAQGVIPGATALRPFYEARLLAQVRGNTVGGGNGAAEGQFDDVRAGFDGQAAALFDDFTGIPFDSSKWTVGALRSEPASGALQLFLVQQDEGNLVRLNTAGDPWALQADVKVAQAALTGTGRVGARIARVLYNDGSAGKGAGVPGSPDVNQPSSQAGDLVAQVNVNGSDVSYAVVRCNVAVCTGARGDEHTFVKPFTSLGAASASGQTLLLWWDEAAKKVHFQLGDAPPVTFDPVAAGYPWARAPRVPFAQVANNAGAASQTVDFTTGSFCQIASEFRNVKVLP